MLMLKTDEMRILRGCDVWNVRVFKDTVRKMRAKQRNGSSCISGVEERTKATMTEYMRQSLTPSQVNVYGHVVGTNTDKMGTRFNEHD